jgi:hypothetical protein
MPLPSTAPPFGDSDIPTLLADMGLAVTIGGVAGKGLLDEEDQILVQDQQRGEVVVLGSTLTVQTSQFPAAAIGQAVVVNGKNFTVKNRWRIGDGALTKIWLGV